MKRNVYILALLFALATGNNVFAYSFSAVAPSGQTLYYNISGNNVTVTYPGTSSSSPYSSYNNKPTGNMQIPSSVTNGGTTYSVTSIGEYAFQYCTGLTSVTIPNSVTSIGGDAFQNCTGLTSVTIPNSVTSIGNHAFINCTGLTSVTIPNMVTSIGSSAFFPVRNIVYNGTATGSSWGALTVNGYVDGYLIYSDNTKTTLTGCSPQAIGEITIPNSVTSIGEYAFYYCTGLTSVTIGNSVTSIGWSAFSGCTSLTSVTIPNSVTSIGSYAFSGCTGLTSVTIPNSVTSIGSRAFNNTGWYNSQSNGILYLDNWCLGYKGSEPTGSLNISTGTRGIGGFAFYGCTGLTSVTIPNSVTSIGDYAFSGCTGLTSVTIPNSVTSIGERAFYNCTGLTQVNWNAVNVTSYTTSTGYLPFSGCTNLATVVFGESVQTIPNYAFYGCTGLTQVNWNAVNITSCSSNAFNGCTNLATVVLGESVHRIPNYAFYNCTGLTQVNWNAVNVTSYPTDTYWHPFRGCTNLATVVFGDSVQTIPNYAFYGCTGLTSVTIPNSVTSIGSYAFNNTGWYNSQSNGILYLDNWCLGYKGSEPTGSLNIPTGTRGIGGFAFSYCTGLTSVTIGNSVTSIGNGAFYDCTGLTQVNWNAVNVTSYDTDYPPFAGCTNLATVVFGDSVQTIPNHAFYGCTGLTQVNWNAVNVTSYPTSTSYLPFIGCTNLVTVVFGESVQTIPNYAFYGCTGLTSVTIPNMVTSIGSSAFYLVRNIVYNGTATGSPWGALTVNGYVDGYLIYSDNTKTTLTGCSTQAFGEITIPNSVTSIGDEAFYNCTGLTQVNWNAVNVTSYPTSTSYLPFSGCTNLMTVVFGDSVQTIPNYAFSACTVLTSVTIPNSVASIGNYAFSGCTGLTNVDVMAVLPPTLGNDVFYNTPNNMLINIPPCTYDDYVSIWGNGNYQEHGIDIELTIVSSQPERGNVSYVLDDINRIIRCDSTAVISATANYGYHFTQWSDGETVNPRTLVITRDTTFAAQFDYNTYAVVVNSSDTVMGIASGTGSANYLTPMTIGATANYGYHFAQWSDGNSDNPRTFVLTQDMNLIAQFTFNTYTITANTFDSSMGEVMGGGTYAYGTTIQLSVEAKPGYHFTCWDDGNTENPRNLLVTKDETLTALYSLGPYEIVASANNEEWGHVTGAGVYNYNDEITLTAVPHEGYRFLHWDNDVALNPYVFAATESLNLVAVFAPATDVTEDELAEVEIYSFKKNIVVTNAEGCNIQIYTSSGQLLIDDVLADSNKKQYRMNVGGIYIVRVNNSKTQKVIIL